MHTVVYDSSFEGLLSAVFDMYYYKLDTPELVKEDAFNGNIFGKVHRVHTNAQHSARVWTGLSKKLSPGALKPLYGFSKLRIIYTLR